MGALFSSKSSNQQTTSQPVADASGANAQLLSGEKSVKGDASGTGATSVTLGSQASVNASTSNSNNKTNSGSYSGNTGKITTGGNDASGKGAKIFNVTLGPPSTGPGNLGAIQPKGPTTPGSTDQSKTSGSSVFSNVEAGGIGLSGTGNKIETTNNTNTTITASSTDYGAVQAGLDAAKAAADNISAANLAALTKVSDLAASQSNSSAAALSTVADLAKQVNTNTQPADATTQKTQVANTGLIALAVLAALYFLTQRKNA